MSWAAELHGGTGATAAGAAPCWLSHFLSVLLVLCVSPACCLAGSSAVQQFSFEIQPAAVGSVAPTYSADLHRGSPLPFLVQHQS